MGIHLPSHDMIVLTVAETDSKEILQWAEASHSSDYIQGIVLYAEEVYMKGNHRIRQSCSSQDTLISSKVKEVVL